MKKSLDKHSVDYSELIFPLSEKKDTLFDAFNHLNILANFLYSKHLSSEVKLLQTEIKKSLLQPLFKYIKRIDIATLREQERIADIVKTQLTNIDKDKNPHSAHMQKKRKLLIAHVLMPI